MHKILCLLEALRQSRTGAVIYHQVERMLDDVLSGQKTVELAYVSLINQLLGAYLGHLHGGSPLKVQVRLLQARLQPPLTVADLEALRDYVDLYSSQIEALKQLDSDLFQTAVEPLLAAFGIADAPRVKSQDDLSEPVASRDNASHPGTKTQEQLHPEVVPVPKTGSAVSREWPFTEAVGGVVSAEPSIPGATVSGRPTSDAVVDPTGNGGDAETQVDTAYRSHLDSKHRDIQKLQATLAQQVLGTIAQNEEFGVLLEVVLGELHQAGDDKELEDLRWTLIREIEKLTKGHHELAEKLDSTHHYLQLIESDSRQLSDELTRVRLLSLTDELTGLPNRRAFLRRIEDEVARAQRYGFPLSLGLIDLDHFKQINDEYGHAGGDEVLQIYSKNILSVFRHHDLVARYGGEEFAVLLPNTDAEGSMRALS
ncbi:MAG: GGDEF domain-containing protein, partial [Thiogranum sp.]